LKTYGLERFSAQKKVKNEALLTVPSIGKTKAWKALKLGVKVANVPERNK
jgi:hypothetical protein